MRQANQREIRVLYKLRFKEKYNLMSVDSCLTNGCKATKSFRTWQLFYSYLTDVNSSDMIEFECFME